MTSCRPLEAVTPLAETTSDSTRLSAADAVSLARTGVLVIDVRAQESKTSHGLLQDTVSLAKHELIPALSPSSTRRLVTSNDTMVILFCTTEAGSGPFIPILRELGLTNVWDVAGGFRALRPLWDSDGK